MSKRPKVTPIKAPVNIPGQRFGLDVGALSEERMIALELWLEAHGEEEHDDLDFEDGE